MVVVAVELEDVIALVVSTAASFLAHPARTAAQQQIAMRVVRCSVNMDPPVSGDGRIRSAGAEPNERKASTGLRQDTGTAGERSRRTLPFSRECPNPETSGQDAENCAARGEIEVALPPIKPLAESGARL
jgi:hypothetical protein